MAEQENSGSGDSSAQTRSLPILAPGQYYGDPGLGSVNPQLLFGGNGSKGPDYLSSNPRSAMERMVYNTGILYLGGLGLGGTYGFFHGLKNAPSSRFKIKVNSMLNGVTGYGARVGNALGVLAIMFSSIEAGSDYLEVDKLVGWDDASPFLAAAGTGMLYKSAQGPKTMVLAGGLATAIMMSWTLGNKYLPMEHLKDVFF